MLFRSASSTSTTMTSAQKELMTALHNMSDSHGGVVAQVEDANNRLECSLERRAKTMDALLHEWKSDLPRIWIPLIAGAAMLIGLFGGIEIQGCRDAVSTAPLTPTQTAEPTVPTPQSVATRVPASSPKPQRRTRAKNDADHER